jgi:hypothetical protein
MLRTLNTSLIWWIALVWSLIFDLFYKLTGIRFQIAQQEEEEEEVEERSDLFLQALTPLVSSGFLSTHDLGRLILLTSKKVRDATFMDVSNEAQVRRQFFWKYLCFARWDSDYATKLQAGFSPMTFQEIFHLFPTQEHAGPTRKHHAFSFRNMLPYYWGPRADPKNYKIMFVVGHNTLVKVVDGQDVADFFEKGNAVFEFDCSIGTWEDERLPFLHVHFVRLTDHRILSLDFEDAGDINVQAEDGTSVTGFQAVHWMYPTTGYVKKLLQGRGLTWLGIRYRPHCVRRVSGGHWGIYSVMLEISCETRDFTVLSEQQLGWLKPGHLFEAWMDT